MSIDTQVLNRKRSIMSIDTQMLDRKRSIMSIDTQVLNRERSIMSALLLLLCVWLANTVLWCNNVDSNIHYYLSA